MENLDISDFKSVSSAADSDHVLMTLQDGSDGKMSIGLLKQEVGRGVTPDAPIPYEQGMAFERGKYYSQYGVVYECILTTQTGYPNDLKDLPTIVKRVEG